MRCFALATVLIVASSLAVPTDATATAPGDIDVRYGMQVNDTYAQSSPRDTLTSVIKAIEADDIKYLLAHLVWPDEVDRKFLGSRDKLVALASKGTPAKRRKLAEMLRRHTARGTWTLGDAAACSQADGAPDVTFSRIGQRWFMRNVPSTE